MAKIKSILNLNWVKRILKYSWSHKKISTIVVVILIVITYFIFPKGNRFCWQYSRTIAVLKEPYPLRIMSYYEKNQRGGIDELFV